MKILFRGTQMLLHFTQRDAHGDWVCVYSDKFGVLYAMNLGEM